MAVSFYFTVVDGKAEPSTMEFFFDDATPMAVLTAGVPAVAAIVRPLLDGGLRTAGIRVEIDVSATWGAVAQLASDVQEKAEFAMRTANGFLSRLNLPTFDEQFFVVGSREVDRTDAAVVTFEEFMEDGITVGGGLLKPTDYRGDSIDVVEKATENWGKRRPSR